MIKTVPGYEGLNQSLYDLGMIHVELGTRCNLMCSGCARTQVIHGDTHYPQLKVQDLGHNVLTQLVRKENNLRHLFFNANFSDPIYCGHLFESFDYMNTLEDRPILHFTTNGSGRNVKWWETFADKFKEGDKLDWSIDGLEDTNHLYRKNAKWNTIMDGVKTAINLWNNKDIHISTTWKFIVFKHNQHQIRQAYDLSKELGFEKFKLCAAAPRTPDVMMPTLSWNEMKEMLDD